MKNNDLSNIIGELDDSLIEQSLAAAPRKKAWIGYAVAAAVALAIAVPAFAVWRGSLITDDPVNTPAPQQTQDGGSVTQSTAEETKGGVRTDDSPKTSEPVLKTVKIGKLYLGMPAKEINDLYGTPTEISNSGEVTDSRNDMTRISWFYDLDGDGAHELSLGMAFEGDDTSKPFLLDSIWVSGNCDLALENGIRIGSPVADVERLMNGSEKDVDGADTFYSSEIGTHILTVIVEQGRVKSILFEHYFDARPDLDEIVVPLYSFSGDPITIYRRIDGKWMPAHVGGKTAKTIGTVMSIEDIVAAGVNGDAQYILDFGNGTAVILRGGENGDVYSVKDSAAFTSALQNGGDPETGLEEITSGEFPTGTLQAVEDAIK